MARPPEPYRTEGLPLWASIPALLLFIALGSAAVAVALAPEILR